MAQKAVVATLAVLGAVLAFCLDMWLVLAHYQALAGPLPIQ